MTDRETIEKIAKDYRELSAMHVQQRALMGKMIRACIKQLSSTKPAERAEARLALGTLADMLEGK